MYDEEIELMVDEDAIFFFEDNRLSSFNVKNLKIFKAYLEEYREIVLEFLKENTLQSEDFMIVLSRNFTKLEMIGGCYNKRNDESSKNNG